MRLTKLNQKERPKSKPLTKKETENLSKDDLIRLLKLEKDIAKIEARESFINHVEYVKSDYDAQWFHEVVAEALDLLQKGTIKKLMIFLPPQHGKSELSSRQFPAYCLGKNPNERIAVCSCSPDVAQGFNREIKLVMNDKKYKELYPETSLNSKNVSTDARGGALNNMTMFQVVGHKGYCRTVGIGQMLTSFSVDLGIIDDPFKDRTTANSPTMRNRVWDWYVDVFRKRLDNKARQLMLFTRWHEDDLAGRILDPENECYDPKEAAEWTVIAIPALKEDEPPLPMAIDVGDPRKIDEALWPEKHAAEKYYRAREHSPVSFASLDQQRPAPLEGGMVKKEWFPIINENELPFNIEDKTWDFTIDGAFTEKSENDESAILASTYHDGLTYVLHAVGIRKELEPFIKYFNTYFLANEGTNQSSLYIEKKASGYSFKQLLRKPEFGNHNCRDVPEKHVSLGKRNRVEACTPFWASGKVVLIKGNYTNRLLNQLTVFPNGKLKDLVDVISYATLRDHLKKKVGRGAHYSK